MACEGETSVLPPEAEKTSYVWSGITGVTGGGGTRDEAISKVL